MPFQPGKSGNPLGRPKRDPNAPTEVSVRRALERVVRSRPDLLEDAIERLLRGSRSTLGMLELAAKLTRELGEESQATKIAIVFTGTLDPAKLKQVDAKVIECPAESKDKETLNDLSLTTSQDLSLPTSFKTQPFVADSTDRLVPASQPQE
jgi:hypothetical protein